MTFKGEERQGWLGPVSHLTVKRHVDDWAHGFQPTVPLKGPLSVLEPSPLPLHSGLLLCGSLVLHEYSTAHHFRGASRMPGGGGVDECKRL